MYATNILVGILKLNQFHFIKTCRSKSIPPHLSTDISRLKLNYKIISKIINAILVCFGGFKDNSRKVEYMKNFELHFIKCKERKANIIYHILVYVNRKKKYNK